VVLKAGSDQDDTAFATIVQRGGRALVVGVDPSFLDRRDHIIALATRHPIPAIYPLRHFADRPMSYGTDFADSYRQAGVYAGRLLKGVKPTDLPVVQAVKFELVVNAQTARMLGLEAPPTLLSRADEVIK
jgi:putative ABC transport system substrate-binding protein